MRNAFIVGAAGSALSQGVMANGDSLGFVGRTMVTSSSLLSSTW